MRRRCGTCWWRGGPGVAAGVRGRCLCLPAAGSATSPGREWHHHSCQGSDDGAVVAGWSFQWLSQLCFDGGSWTAPQDQVRAGAGDDATRKAAQQIIAHSARLRAAGERRIPLYVHDAGYDEAPLTSDLREHLDRVQVLVRLRNDRVMYRDPPPRVPGGPGGPRKHGSDRFECKNPATWGDPDQELSRHDERYGQVSVMSWGGLHPKLACRGRFAGFAGPPVIKRHLIRVTVERLPNGERSPGRCGCGGPPGHAGPGPDLARLPAPVRRRARLPVRQDRPGLGQGHAPRAGSGEPPDLADPLRPHPAAPGPPYRRGSPAALGTPPQARDAHPRTRPPRFRPPGRPRRHAGQPAKTLPGRPWPTQRTH